MFGAPMARTAGKAKTRKSVAKRFKITGTGKVLRRKQGKRHLLIRKNAKRKRNLGKAALVSPADAKNIKQHLPFS
jgi:large subunit ribosomal protein L35